MNTETTHIKTETQLIPELRFKEFDGAWQKKKFGDLSQRIGDGLHGTPKYVEESDIYFINGNNLINGNVFITDKTKKVDINTFLKNDKKLSHKTLLISLNGTIGNIARYNNEKVMLGKSVGYFNFKTESNFYYHFLNSPKTQQFFVSELTGSTIKNLSLKTLRETIIPFPSLPEQQKIASFLTAVDQKIQQLTKKKDLLAQYKKGVMQQLFSGKLRFKDENGNAYPDWDEKKISKVCIRSTGRSKSNEIIETGKNIIVDMGAVSREGKLLGSKRTNCVEDYLETVDLVMAKDDIGGGQIIGKVVLIPLNGKYILGDHVYRLKVMKGDVKFLYYSINSYAVNKSFRRKANGTAQIGINNKTVDDQLIPFPCVEEQQKIASYISSIDAKIESVHHQITQTQTFKKGLLQQLFV